MKKNNKRTTQHSIKNPRSKIASEAVFILLTVLGIYIFIAFYTRNPNEVPFTSISDNSVSLLEAKNKAGGLGALLADLFINRLLGNVAYIIPISLLWLGYNFHRDAGKERKYPLIFISRLIAYLVMLFFTAALAHRYAAEFTIKGNIKGLYDPGGDIGRTIHNLFGGVFGEASTIIYVGIIIVSFSIAGSSSWKNISNTILGKNKDHSASSRIQSQQIKPTPAINNSQKIKPKEKIIKSKETKKTKKAEKAEKPQKVGSSNLYKATTSSVFDNPTIVIWIRIVP